jgi:1,4-alpha-glucan branching enzyme
VLTFAEESTAWGGVSKPVEENGLGFDFKWNMGWMNDTLSYMEKDSIYRAYHHDQLTFSLVYAFSEHFILPFSHDEVVHLKGSMIKKMPGDDWQKFANLRLLYAYMYAHPGKKLLFMGCEFAQWEEWNEAKSLDWHLADFDRHKGVSNTVSQLNKIYSEETALHQVDNSWEGFEWIDLHNREQSILSFVRYNADRSEHIVCAFNFTPTPHKGYWLGVPEHRSYKEILNTDHEKLHGSGIVNPRAKKAKKGDCQGRAQYLEIDLPPLGVVFFKAK